MLRLQEKIRHDLAMRILKPLFSDTTWNEEVRIRKPTTNIFVPEGTHLYMERHTPLNEKAKAHTSKWKTPLYGNFKQAGLVF